MRDTGFRKDKVVVTLFILVVIAGIAAVVQAYYILNLPGNTRVLKFPLQRVENLHKTGTIPVISINDDVLVAGSKCNISNTTVYTVGSLYWHPIAPGGESILIVSDASATRPPGCKNFDYVNTIPEEVKFKVCNLINEGFIDITWELTGTEVPTDPNFLPETWRTEPFILKASDEECEKLKTPSP